MIRIFTSKPQSFGELGEKGAVLFLKKKGFLIVERNVPNKFGEIDIVARRGRDYWFFEVKTGKLDGTINPAENLTREKIRKFLISVEYYCLTKDIQNYRVQALLVLQGPSGKFTVETVDLF